MQSRRFVWKGTQGVCAGVRRLLMVGLGLLCSCAVWAQSGNSQCDVGFLLGVTGYTGDLNQSPLPNNIGGHGGFFVRYNFNEMYALRVNLLGGAHNVRYNPDRYYIPIYPEEPESQTLGFTGLDANVEINFMRFEVNDFCKQRFNTRWIAPYVTLGVGVGFTHYLNPWEAHAAFYIPMGGGVKFAVSGRLTLAPEIRFMKLFSDKVDRYSNWSNKGDFQIHNRDWLSFVSFTLSYRLFTNVVMCPVYQ